VRGQLKVLFLRFEKNFDTVLILLKFYLKPANDMFETIQKYGKLIVEKFVKNREAIGG